MKHRQVALFNSSKKQGDETCATKGSNNLHLIYVLIYNIVRDQISKMKAYSFINLTCGAMPKN